MSASKKARLEKSIERAEQRLAAISEEEQSAASDYEALQRLYEEKTALEKQRDSDMEEWLILEEEQS